jgi:hypothetical protein
MVIFNTWGSDGDFQWRFFCQNGADTDATMGQIQEFYAKSISLKEI